MGGHAFVNVQEKIVNGTLKKLKCVLLFLNASE